MATLTIADLDNGKRDLETVDAVANSQPDTTTTRYGDAVLTLAGALRRLGWQAPRSYASGLSITSATVTVERGGIVYRPDPDLVPFTTGAWNPNQWRVIQNTNDSNRVYQFPTLLAAQSAAATLPEGSTVIVDGDSIGRVVSGLYVPISAAPPAVVRDYTGLRAYSGKSNLFQVTAPRIAGFFSVVPGDSSSTDNGGTLIVLADSRRVRRLFTGEAMAEWFGVSVLAPDSAPAIMAALAAVNPLPVRLPAGVINTSKITLNSFDALLGQGSEATTLRLKGGANSDLLYAANSDALWGTNSINCIKGPRLEGFKIVGNRANNTAGCGVALYAERPIIHDLIITDMPDDGIRTEWSNSASESLYGLEGRFSKIQIYRNGRHGWRFAGPHDSHCEDIVIFSSSLKADRTYQNLWIEKGNARWSKVHSYSTADILPLRVQHSLLISAAGSGNEFTMSHLEGGATNVRIIGNSNILDDSCRVYYPWNRINVALAGNGNIINCFCGEEYRGIGLPKAVAVEFAGDAGGASGNYIDVIAGGCGGGAIGFGGSAGANVIRARGYNPLVNDVGYAGLPALSDEVDIRVIGGLNTTLRQTFGYQNAAVAALSGFGGTQGDATQIPANIPVIKLNGGASGSGVRLPNATDVRNGAEVTLFNTTAGVIKIYPSSGGNIAGLGANNPLSLPALKTARLIVIDGASGQWGTMVG